MHRLELISLELISLELISVELISLERINLELISLMFLPAAAQQEQQVAVVHALDMLPV